MSRPHSASNNGDSDTDEGAGINQRNGNISVPVSHVYDNSNDQLSTLQNNYTELQTDNTYPLSFFLTEISTRLWNSEKINVLKKENPTEFVAAFSYMNLKPDGKASVKEQPEVKRDKKGFLVEINDYIKQHKKKRLQVYNSTKFKKISKTEFISINVPPEKTIMKIWQSNKSALLHTAFGKYRDIPTENIKNYKKYIIDPSHVIQQNEEDFRAFSQIEAIRNPSALLTSAMFFDLAGEKFDSVRPLQSLANKRYAFEKIAEQMPMSMIGACKGTFYLYSKFENKLTYKYRYDERQVNDEGETEGKKLDSRNINILFDWLSFKMKIYELLNLVNKSEVYAKGTEDYAGWCLKEGDYRKQAEKDGYSIILEKGTTLGEQFKKEAAKFVEVNIPDKLLKINEAKENKGDATNDTPKEKNICIAEGMKLGQYYLQKEENGKYTLKDEKTKLLGFNAQIGRNGDKDVIQITNIEFDPTTILELTKDFCLTEIKSFPLKVFNELFEEWYNITLDYLNDPKFNIDLKAAAEPNYEE